SPISNLFVPSCLCVPFAPHRRGLCEMFLFFCASKCEASMSEQPQDIESALFICSDRPEAAMADIAQLDRLGAFTLMAEPDQMIRDIHFDAGESVLWAKGIALRARQNNQTQLITLKGPPQLDAAGL